MCVCTERGLQSVFAYPGSQECFVSYTHRECSYLKTRMFAVGRRYLLQVEHTRDVMSEVEAVSNQYDALAVSCSQLYFALETLRDVHFLYHFSLRFFQDILAEVRWVMR